jgi:hypothetical protein
MRRAVCDSHSSDLPIISQNDTLLLARLRRRLQSRHDRLVEDILQLVLRQRRALHVLDCSEFLRHALAVFLPNGLHLRLRQLLAHLRVVAEIGLCADDQAGDAGAVVVHFGEPFLADVLEGGGAGDAEAHEEDVGLRIGEGAEAVVVFLASSVEEAEGVGLVADPGAMVVSFRLLVAACSCDAKSPLKRMDSSDGTWPRRPRMSVGIALIDFGQLQGQTMRCEERREATTQALRTNTRRNTGLRLELPRKGASETSS